MPKDSKAERQKKNKARKDALKAKKRQSYRRKNSIGLDEEEVLIAPIWRRVIQYCIDQFMLGLFSFLSFLAIYAFFDSSDLPLILSILPQTLFGLGYIVPAVYLRGQTFGMKKLKIMVINVDGTGYISKSSSVIRWFLLFVIPNSYIFIESSPGNAEDQILLGILSIFATMVIVSPMILSDRRRGLHDIAARSMMVYVPPDADLEDKIG